MVLVDRSQARDGALPRPLPWLAKRDALREAVIAIATSAAAARADLGRARFRRRRAVVAAAGEARPTLADRRARGERDAVRRAADTLERALEFLDRRRAQLPRGSFVFVLSDFLAPPASEWLRRASATAGTSCPVVIQDPVWEQSFPAVGGVGVARSAIPAGRRRAGPHEPPPGARARREANARRHERCCGNSVRSACGRSRSARAIPGTSTRLFIAWVESERCRPSARPLTLIAGLAIAVVAAAVAVVCCSARTSDAPTIAPPAAICGPRELRPGRARVRRSHRRHDRDRARQALACGHRRCGSATTSRRSRSWGPPRTLRADASGDWSW